MIIVSRGSCTQRNKCPVLATSPVTLICLIFNQSYRFQVPGSTATIMSTNSKAFSWLSSFKSSSSSFNIPRLSSQTHSRIQLTRFPKPFPWSILPISLVFTIILSSSLIGQLNGQSVLTQLLAPRIQNLLDSVLPERTPMIPTGGIMHPHRAKGRMRRPPPNPGALPYSSSLSMTRVRRPPLQLAHHRIPQSLSTSFHRQNGRGAMFLKGVDSSLNSLSFPSSGPLNLFTAESVSFSCLPFPSSILSSKNLTIRQLSPHKYISIIYICLTVVYKSTQFLN